MKKVIKIKITGYPAETTADRAYQEKLVVRNDGISYKYEPGIRSKFHPCRKWTYKTDSSCFRKQFAGAAKAAARDLKQGKTDAPMAAVVYMVITYADGTKAGKTFLGKEDFECFDVIRQMIPACEKPPKMLCPDEEYVDEELKKKLYREERGEI